MNNYQKAILEARDCKPERIKCRKCKIQEVCQSLQIKQWLKGEEELNYNTDEICVMFLSIFGIWKLCEIIWWLFIHIRITIV